jgi:heat shock protein HtpX
MTDPALVAVARRQRVRNLVQGVVLLGGIVLIALGVVWVLSGGVDAWWVALLVVLAVVARPRLPTAWVLRMYGAVPVSATAAPQLAAVVETLARRAGLQGVPRLYYVPSTTLNAFAVGRGDQAAVAITDGLLRSLSPREITGVLAHELSHIRAGDTWIMNLADTLGRVTQALANAGLLLLFLSLPMVMAGSSELLTVAVLLSLAPTLINLLQLALSRTREYDADIAAATLTNDPQGLAHALERLERHAGRLWERIMVGRRRVPDPLVLRTHPPTSERVRRLRSLTPAPSPRIQPGGELQLPGQFRPVTQTPRLRFPGVRW